MTRRMRNAGIARQRADLRDHIVNLAFERGLLTLGCGNSTIRISPPLSITRAEMDAGLQIFEEAITLAEEKSASQLVS